MSMLELDFHLPEFGNLIKDLGLEEGGRAQQHLVKSRNTLQTKTSGTPLRLTALPVLSGLSASWLPKKTGSLRMNAGTF